MREDMQHGFERPVGLIIIKIVLRKTAHVQRAKMRVDAGPAVGCRLATIIKTRPREPARRPRTGIVVGPPGFGRLAPAYPAVLDVITPDETVHGVIGVNAAIADQAGRFRADDG